MTITRSHAHMTVGADSPAPMLPASCINLPTSPPLSPLPSDNDNSPHSCTASKSSSHELSSNMPLSSPMNMVLLYSVSNICTTVKSINEDLAVENNPHPLHNIMCNSAEYWVRNDGNVWHLKFITKLDTAGHFAKFGPYFNLQMGGVRAQIELRPLSEDEVAYPPEAIRSSRIAVETLLIMCSEVELARNTSKAKACATATSHPSHCPKKSPGSRIWQFDDMPDPNCHYASLKSGHDLEDITVHSPDVFDTNCVFIHAVEYNTKLLHEQVVEVDVILRLWTFKPSAKDLNGSHVYQLMLQKYVKNNLVYHSLPHTPDHKGKRKASVSPTDQSPSKKNSTLREVEDTASMHVDDM
ncbi:hypothetical protein EDC04DRAFT_2971825 [Pisolithus marmoratus]|nr:hypothetical protein EDC04DRAFT_2971825 [Pisolithus marmoratus]